MAVLLAVVLTGFQSDLSVRPEVISSIILNQQEQLTGLSLEYEGRLDHPPFDRASGWGAEFASYTGAFSLRSEKQSIRVELFYVYPNNKATSNNSHQVIVSLGGRSKKLSQSNDGRKAATIQTTSENTFDTSGSYERILPINQVRRLFSSPIAVPKHEGMEVIDGHSCAKVVFYYAPGVLANREKDPNILMERWWFDLGRGAHVLKREIFLSRSNPVVVLRDVKLHKFQIRGRELWLPVDGIYEFLEDRGSPSGREFYHVNQSTVTLKSFTDEDFEVKIKPGTFVSDELRRKQYEYGQDIRPAELSRDEAEQRLREQLDVAERQSRELNASQPTQAERDYLYWGLLAIASTTAAIVLIHVIRVRIQQNRGAK